jgi:hypothetical protein
MYSATDTDMYGSHSIDLSALTPVTVYHFAIISTDSSGNTTTSSDQMFTTAGTSSDESSSTATSTTATSTTATSTLETSVPVISSIATSPSSDGTNATITWTTDQPSTSQVIYGTASSIYINSSAIDTNLVTGHSVTLSGLSPGMTYYFVLFSGNSAGMTSYTPEQMFVSTATSSTATSTVATSTSTTASTTAAVFELGAVTGTTQAYVGAPVSITATAENAGLDVGEGNVDIEVYDPSGNLAYQQTFAQDFSTNHSESYPISFTPAMTGTYTVKVGAFDSAWSKNYSWNDNALTISVAAAGTSATTTTTTGTSSSTVNTSYPDMTLTPTTESVVSNQHVDFNGRDFPHEEDVNVYDNGVWVSKAHADGGGNFTTGSLTMPSAAGTYTFTFVGATTGAEMSSTIIVQ